MFFKLVVFVAIVACAFGAPSGVALWGHQPLLTQTVIGSAPATISKSSSTVVHGAALAVPSVQLVQQAPVLAHQQLLVPAVQHSAIIGSVPSSISHSSSHVVHNAALVQSVPQVIVGAHGHGW